MQYRFGIKNAIELLYPAKLEHPKNHFFHHIGAYSGGYMAHLSFKNSQYTYVVYDHFSSAHSPIEQDQEESGVLVVNGVGKETAIRCLDRERAKIYNDVTHIFQDDDFYPYK